MFDQSDHLPLGSVESLAYMKERLVARLATRLRAVESGELVVVGVNRYEDTEPSPLAQGVGSGLASIERIEEETEDEQIERLGRWRSARDDGAVRAHIDGLKRAAADGESLVEPSTVRDTVARSRRAPSSSGASPPARTFAGPLVRTTIRPRPVQLE